MIIHIPINRGFSFWPFIFMPSRLKETPAYKAYLMHEQVHHRRQGIGVVWWVLKWFFNRKFRHDEELLAFEVQLNQLKQDKVKYLKHKMTNGIAYGYRKAFTLEEATALVEKYYTMDNLI